MNPAGVLCDLLLVPCLIAVAAVLVITGGAGAWAGWRVKDNGTRPLFIIVLILGVALALWVSTAFIPKEFWLSLRPTYHLGDKELEPYQHAITDIDRESLGFTPISKDADIKILGNSDGYVACPDVELYIPDLPFKRQHICLEKHGSAYDWYSEYEVYLGPEQADTLWLAYSSKPYALGGGDNKPYAFIVEYRGPKDSRVPDGPLTLTDVQPIIAEWRNYHLSHP